MSEHLFILYLLNKIAMPQTVNRKSTTTTAPRSSTAGAAKKITGAAATKGGAKPRPVSARTTTAGAAKKAIGGTATKGGAAKRPVSSRSTAGAAKTPTTKKPVTKTALKKGGGKRRNPYYGELKEAAALVTNPESPTNGSTGTVTKAAPIKGSNPPNVTTGTRWKTAAKKAALIPDSVYTFINALETTVDKMKNIKDIPSYYKHIDKIEYLNSLDTNYLKQQTVLIIKDALLAISKYVYNGSDSFGRKEPPINQLKNLIVELYTNYEKAALPPISIQDGKYTDQDFDENAPKPTVMARFKTNFTKDINGAIPFANALFKELIETKTINKMIWDDEYILYFKTRKTRWRHSNSNIDKTNFSLMY